MKVPTLSALAALDSLYHGVITAESFANCCTWSGPSTRAHCWRHAWMVLINAGPEIWLTESHIPGTDVRPNFRSIRLLASLHCHSLPSMSERSPGARWPRSSQWDPPSNEDGDHDRGSEPSLIRSANQQLAAFAIENLNIHKGGRSVEHDRPCERLKSRVGQSSACIGVPAEEDFHLRSRSRLHVNPLHFVRQEALAHRSHDEGQAVEEAVRHAARELGTSAGSAIADVPASAQQLYDQRVSELQGEGQFTEAESARRGAPCRSSRSHES